MTAYFYDHTSVTVWIDFFKLSLGLGYKLPKLSKSMPMCYFYVQKMAQFFISPLPAE